MINVDISLSRLDYAIKQVCHYLEQSCNPTVNWKMMSEEVLWRELVSCILGSRVRYDVSCSAMDSLDRNGLFSNKYCFSSRSIYEQAIFNALSTESRFQKQNRYPFPRLRAKQISLTATNLFANGGTIHRLLEKAKDIRDARRVLVKEVIGLGPKQASLFLRNIGYGIDIAVLDIHVLTYMNWVGLVSGSYKTVQTIRKYEMLENIFIEHSYSNGFIPSKFDLAVWIVVRIIKKERFACH